MHNFDDAKFASISCNVAKGTGSEAVNQTNFSLAIESYDIIADN